MVVAKREISVTARVAVIVCAATTIFFCVAAALNYFYISDFLRNSAGEDQAGLARLIALSVADKVDRKIELAQARLVREETGATPAGSLDASIGSIKVDEKTGVWSLPVNVALLDDAGKALADQEISVDIEDISGPIKDFKIGPTGNAALVDDRAYLVYAPGAKPFSHKLCSYNVLQKALDTDKGWVLMDGVFGHRGMVFASFYRVEGGFLPKNNIKWWIFVVRDADAITKPLNAVMPKMLIVGAVLSVLALLAGIVMGKIAIRPVAKLRADIDGLSGRNKMAEEKVKKFTDYLVLVLARVSAVIPDIKQGLKAIADILPAPTNEKHKELMATENSNIDTLSSSLQDLSDMARIEAGELELNMQVVDIKEIIKSSIFVFEPKIRGKGLDLKLNILKGRVDVYADANRIKQLLSNLFNSAVMSTDKGSIGILLKEKPDDVEFSITDTGKGVLSGKATDLGLYISKAIIEKHNGKFWFENVPNKGSIHSFRLPKHNPKTA